MKQTFLKTHHARAIVSRRMGMRENHFGNAAYKSDAPEMTAEELLEKVKTTTREELEKRGYQSKKEVDDALELRMAALKDVPLEALRAYQADKEATTKLIADNKAALEAQGIELRAMKDAQLKALPDRKTIASQIRAAMEANKDKFDAFRRGESKSFGTDAIGNADIKLEGTRAAITMTVGASSGASAFVPGVELMPGLVDLARNQPFIENNANTANTTKARIVWTEKYNPQGNAAFLGEGDVKPLISFEIRTIESYAKKVADKIKVSTEMLDDVDFIAAEIEAELEYKVNIAVDAALLTGTGDGSSANVNLKGLNQYVGGYVLTTIKTTTPNNFDAIRAAAAQIKSMNFMANKVFINPIDAANMDLVKDTQGRPLAMQYKDANGAIYRIQPIETNQIPVGYVLIGDMTRFKIRNYQAFAVSYGWVNDDFERNLVTIIGERRLHAFVAANDVGAFVYTTFALIKTAITAP